MMMPVPPLVTPLKIICYGQSDCDYGNDDDNDYLNTNCTNLAHTCLISMCGYLRMETNLKSIRNATGNKSTAVQGFFNTFFSEHLKSSEITIYADIRQGVQEGGGGRVTKVLRIPC